MTRKRRRRPIEVNGDPLSRLMPTPCAEVDVVLGRFDSALRMIEAGQHPGENEWRDLADAINTVEALTLRMGLLDVDATMPEVRAATDAMVAAARRWRETGRMGFDGPGLLAVRAVLDTYEVCARGFTKHAMVTAGNHVKEAYRKAREGLAGTEVFEV